MKEEEFKDISGSKKGGGGSRFYEEDNTLQSTATVQVLEVLSAGPIKGLVGGGKGIYLNNTPLVNADGTKNYGGKVAWDVRLGYPDQPYMEGFPSASSEVAVNTQVIAATPVTYTTSSADIDFMYVTVGLPEGLYDNTSGNRLQGSEVELKIEKRLGAGTWTLVKQFTINGKTINAYEESHHVPRPTGAGTWSVRLSRISADSTDARLRNATWFNRVTEGIDAKLTYDDVAYVGVGVDSATVNSSQIPTRSYLIDGRLIKVPSNYNVSTRVYSGVWNGTFKFECSDNPAWVIYDLLADPVNGLGIDESLIDKYSFYNAAVYNDEEVNIYRNGVVIGTEPRFRFAYQLLARQDINRWVQDIAATMNAKVVWMGGKATVLQDRPTSVSKLITTSNVIDGMFEYVSSPKQDRVTAVNVTWNDPENYYQQAVCTVDASSTYGTMRGLLYNATQRYGYESLDIVALGAFSEGQARRAGLWKLDTVLNQTEAVKFRMFLNGYDLAVGEVVELFDENYAGAQQAGRIGTGSTTTSIVLDRPVTLTAASTISVRLADGTIETKNIVQTSGSLSTITVSSAFSAAPVEYNDFIIKTTLSPRQFRITKTSLDEEGHVNVEAVQHDPNKYTRIETGLNVPAPVYSDVLDSQVSAPTGLVFKEAVVNEDNTLTRSLNVSWVRPATGAVTKYIFKWQYNKGGWSSVETAAPSADIRNANAGIYEVKVYAVGYNSVVGAEVVGSYTIVNDSGAATSTLNPPTTLQVIGGGTTFNDTHLAIEWTNPSSNANVTTDTIRDFEVKVYDMSDATLRTEYVPAVAAGQKQYYTYTFDKNVTDGGPRRQFKIRVRIRDAKGNFTTTNPNVTFSNPAPAALSDITVTSGVSNIFISYTSPTVSDVAGVLIWRSTTSGFTPSAGNLYLDTTSNFITDVAPFGTTYYYKLAAYDSFGRPEDGTGLNISTQYTGASDAADGIPEVASLPDPSGYTGPKIVYNESDGKLWSYVDGAWEETIPPVSDVLDGSITVAKFAAGLRPVEIVGSLPAAPHTEGRVVFLTTDNKLYRNDGSGWVATVASTDISGQLTNSQIADLAASKLTGQIVASQIEDAAITTAKFAAGLAPVEIVGALPGSGNFEGRTVYLTTDDKLYRYTGSAWTSAVPAADISGQLTNSQIADLAASKLTGQIVSAQIQDAAITTAKFASTVKPVEVLGALPGTPHVEGRMVYLTTDNKLYRNDGSGWVASVAAADVAGQLTNSQLAAIDAAKVTGQLTAGQLDISVGGGNMLYNSSFEGDADGNSQPDGWNNTSFGTGITIVRGVDSDALFGTKSSKMEVTAISGASSNGHELLQELAYYPYVVAGEQYSLSCYAKVSTLSYQVRLRISWIDSGGATISTGTPFLGALNAINTWQRVGGTINAPAGAVRARVRYGIIRPSAGDTTLGSAWFDGIQMEGGDVITAYAPMPGEILAGSITATEIADNAVTTPKLIAGAITTDKIAAGAVTANEIAANTITAAKIASGTITSAQIAADTITAGNIATGAITATEIASGAVTTAKIAAGAVTANEIAANTITAGQIAAGAVATSELAADAVTTDKIAAGAITATEIASNAVTAAKILAGTITGDKLAANTITATQIASNTITAAEIAANAITSSELAANSVIAGKIAAGAITATEIASGAITTAKLAAGAVTANELAANSVTGAKILAGTISADKIGANVITADQIAANAITSSELAANSVIAGKIAAAAVSATEIAASAITTTKLAVTDMSRVFSEVFETSASISEWTNYSGSGELSIVNDAVANFGGKALQVGNNSGNDQAWLIHNRNIPFDKNVTYRIRARIRRALGTGTVYLGWAGVAGDGTTFVNVSGTNGFSSQHYHGVVNTAPGASYTEFTGYTSGYGASAGTGSQGTLASPGQMHPNVRYIRPLVLVNYNGTAGTMFIDSVMVDVVADAELIVNGAITADKVATNAITTDKIAANAITAGKIAASTITATQIASNAITSAKIAADAVTADKINVSSLSAITATIGTLRTATSGARTEIKDNVIEVYDSSNVLRVKLGVW